MIPNTGSYAKFTFVNKLDSLNGIYQVVGIENFDEALLRGVDFYKLLYTPAGLSKEDWANDYNNYKGEDVYWIQPTDSTKDKIPVPYNLLASIPDINVGKYYNFSLISTVGIYDTPDMLSGLASQINDMISTVTGEKSNTYWTASAEGAIYKTKGEYQTLDNTRKANAKALTPLTTQINTLNKTIDDLKARNNYLEQALIETINKLNKQG